MGISQGSLVVNVANCSIFTQRRSVVKNVGCFQRRLFVCLFVCQHDNFQTSKHRMMKLGCWEHCTTILTMFEFAGDVYISIVGRGLCCVEKSGKMWRIWCNWRDCLSVCSWVCTCVNAVLFSVSWVQLALGDALSYMLTTADNELGVVIATSESGKSFSLLWSSVIFFNDNENENGEKWENNELVNENKLKRKMMKTKTKK